MFRNIILAAVLITIPLVASISGYRQTNSGGEDIEAKLSNCYTYIHPPYEGQPTYNYNCNNSKQGLNGTLENASSQQTASKLLNEEDEEYDGQTPTVNRPNSEVALAEKVSKGVFELSQKLITRVLEQSQNKFEVMSPVSVSAALQLAFLGAKGSTYDELREVLGYNKDYELKTDPYKAHVEFAALLNDLVADVPNPSRAQPTWKVLAREYLSQREEYYSNDSETLKSYHQISVANGIFVQSGDTISEDYKQAVENIYKSDFKELNFKGDPAGSARTINTWVNNKTNGRIKEIIPGAANTETKIVLANALYFKAEWEEMFIEGATSTKKFYPKGKQNADTVDVEMMAHGGKFPYFNDKLGCNCQIIGITYKKNLTTMYVILPNESTPERLREVQICLTADKMNALIEKMERKTAVILFPKMHLSGGFSLKSYLQEIGLKNIFNSQISDLSLMTSSNSGSNQRNQQQNSNRYNSRQKRDLSYKSESENFRSDKKRLRLKDFVLYKRITKSNPGKKYRNKRQADQYQPLKNLHTKRRTNLRNPGWFADDVLHKVDLTINERGTEGGAATAITLTRSGTNVIFRADVPFMMLIRHDTTKLPLFYGAVFEPVNDV